MNLTWVEIAAVGGGAAAIVSAIVNVVAARKRAQETTEGKVDQLYEHLQMALDTTNGILNKHLIDCANRNGAAEAEFKNVVASVMQMQRAIEGLQRTVSNWMTGRDDRRVTIERKGPND